MLVQAYITYIYHRVFALLGDACIGGGGGGGGGVGNFAQLQYMLLQHNSL